MKISISRIKLFKSCRRAYYLKYIENLEPVEQAEPLVVGSNYHELIEQLYNDPDTLTEPEEYSKEYAMVAAYKKYIYPMVQIHSCEAWYEKEYCGHTLIGRVDGITENGVVVEHKTTSAEINDEYEYGLQWDEQILMYMFLTGAREIIYTVIRKPTIRQKKNETDEEFYNRMVAWYDEDTDTKIKMLNILRTDTEINEFAEELQAVIHELESAVIYKNTNYCNRWGRRCEYASICLHYDPSQTYIEFQKGNRNEDGT